jgi:hypothetical protein
MAIVGTDLADLGIGTLDDLERLKFSQIIQTLQGYEVMGKWLKKDKVKFKGGKGIKRTLMLKQDSVSGHVGLYDEDDINVADHLADMTIPWVHAKTAWAFEYRSDVLMNTGEALVQDVIKPRRINAMIDMADTLEAAGWTCPADDSSNVTTPYGIPYWVVYNATEGFTGTCAAHATNCGGINTTTYPKWKNWSANYTTANYADLTRKMRKAHMSMNYKSPVDVPQLRGPLGERYRVYCDFDVAMDLEDSARQGNDNLGTDIASVSSKANRSRGLSNMDGRVVFYGHPIIPVAHIEANGIVAPIATTMTTLTSPVYMIDHQSFYPVCLSGDYLRETAKTAPHQVNLKEVYVWLTYNFICINRRCNAVFATASA